jgi:hypothetical protein
MIGSQVVRVLVMSAMIAALVAPVTIFSESLASQSDAHPDTPPAVIRQDKSAALTADIAILANETNYPTESVARTIAFQQAFAEYADELIARFPEQISSVWTAPIPETRGHIQFTGEVPQTVFTEVVSRGLGPNVVFTRRGEISMAGHLRRAKAAAEALAKHGYRNVVTFFDPIKEAIQIELQLPEGASRPNILDLVDVVQDRMWVARSQSGESLFQGRAAEVRSRDIELTVITGSGPIVKTQNSRGGNWLLNREERQCTSGWSVGYRLKLPLSSILIGGGIITAGHCGEWLRQFEEPGVTPYGMTFVRLDWGPEGDVALYETDREELAEFYADASMIRDVNGVMGTNTMVGNYVCFYGRSSNIRTCNHIVQAVGVTTFQDFTRSVGNLARASNDSSIEGDSGGGWSFGTIAWGIHSGADVDKSRNNSYFMPVQEAEAAIHRESDIFRRRILTKPGPVPVPPSGLRPVMQ